MTSSRTKLLSVAACLAGAGLALYAVTRIWSVQVEHRTGLSDLRTEQTGAESQPWLIGLALPLPRMVLTELLWNDPRWVELAPRLMAHG